MSRKLVQHRLLGAATAQQSWCALSTLAGMGQEGRQDSVKHGLPTSIFAYANPEVGA